MSRLPPSLRKAAVLIAALDEPTAEAILRQMGDEDAAKVRSALVELADIPAEEQQQVLAAFLEQQNDSSAGRSLPGDVSLELDPAIEAAVADLPAFPPKSCRSATVETPSFDFLLEIDSKALAAVLSRELPQTVAVVVSRLPAERAAAVLEQLPSSLATDALERLAWIDELSPEVQADLIRELRRQLAPHIKTAQATSTSLAHMAAVLSAMDLRQRHRVVHQLGQRNASLLNRLGVHAAVATNLNESNRVVAMRYRIDSPRRSSEPEVQRRVARNEASTWLAFEDLVQLDDEALRAVCAAADAEMALLALTGADRRLVARILRKLPPRDASTLRYRLEHPLPLRLREVEQARTALAAVASRLAHEGKINLPPSVRFAAAI